MKTPSATIESLIPYLITPVSSAIFFLLIVLTLSKNPVHAQGQDGEQISAHQDKAAESMQVSQIVSENVAEQGNTLGSLYL